MPTVNLELQLKFLNELDSALADALGRYNDASPEKLAELEYMQREVTRARRVINDSRPSTTTWYWDLSCSNAAVSACWRWTVRQSLITRRATWFSGNCVAASRAEILTRW